MTHVSLVTTTEMLMIRNSASTATLKLVTHGELLKLNYVLITVMIHSTPLERPRVVNASLHAKTVKELRVRALLVTKIIRKSYPSYGKNNVFLNVLRATH